ncbi:MAG: hypothetical protein HN855_15430 [Anaerolineae bacterium]|mgnify:FL=1|nr:hypothetical protein [Anaerolineae bacterium]MBT7326548.1 hypothetical protein [Anaerolineae bacterium]
MEALSYFGIPPMAYRALPILAALALAAIAYFGAGILSSYLSRKSEIGRLDNFSAGRAAGIAAANLQEISIGSADHRVRLAFKSIGFDAKGNEAFYLMVGRVAAGAIIFVILLIVGLPVVTSLSGFLAGFVFVNGWVTRAWNKMRTEMESEIPSLLTRLASALQIAPNVPGALEIVGDTLRRDGPLHAWTVDLAGRMHAQGHGAMKDVRKDAATVSPSLSIVTELISRMWQTGGSGYHAAFAAASENLESVLDARVMARAKGGSAQKTANTLVILIVVMIAFLTRGDAMAEVTQQPFVQAAYAVIVLVVVYGHSVISNIIDDSV